MDDGFDTLAKERCREGAEMDIHGAVVVGIDTPGSRKRPRATASAQVGKTRGIG